VALTTQIACEPTESVALFITCLGPTRGAVRLRVPQGDSGKSRWREIGAVFAGQKGTLTVLLDALPLSGKIVLLPPDMPKEETTDDIA